MVAWPLASRSIAKGYARIVRVIEDAAWVAFDQALTESESAIRLKQIRDEPIVLGRATVTLFELAPAGDRPHPRMRMAFTELADPSPPPLPEPRAWSDPDAFRTWLIAGLVDQQLVAGLDKPPAKSPRYWQNSLLARRITALLEHARAALEQLQGWSEAELDAARYTLAEIGALAYAGTIAFDDEDTGTYHSFLRDEPFVHVLELLRASLPAVDTDAFALLPSEQQDAIRRQRTQLTNHIDFLMRNKYALYGIVETDIERYLGGFLIDRDTRQIASERPDTRDSLRPQHELLRINPLTEHPHAGEWLMRTEDGLMLRDGTLVEVPDDQLLRLAVPPHKLTFARAPNHPLLRAGVRFDWNGDGWVEQQPLDWIAWAGHCDAKAVLEQIGLTMLDQPSVFEYRSDTGAVIELSRKLLLELLTSVVELGSVYERFDGPGEIVRGIHQFGGARNDSLPDRLQFDGLQPGQHVRWPSSTKRDALQITAILEDGEPLDLDVAFARCVADVNAIDFHPNPRYLGTIEGDYNLIDASGMVIEATARVSRFDVNGQLVQELQQIQIDLRPETSGRTFLGTELYDAVTRELFRVYLDHDQHAVIAELWRWDPQSGQELHDPDYDIVEPLAQPLYTTVSREMRIDDPETFQALIELALRRGENICADTDFQSPVWNGVVTRMQVERAAVNEAARVERWHVAILARFGAATLDFMVRRAADGAPESYCPVASPNTKSPDFLWQDLPDIASKGVEQGSWVVNKAMQQREIVRVRKDPNEQGGWYVQDDHIKNCFELLYAALAGYRYTIVHQNKRYVFEDEAAWLDARARLDELRSQLAWTEEP
jgi:hypothetical protein